MPEVIDAIRTLLRDNWTIGNTGGRKPFIEKIWDTKNPQPKGNQDFVLLYEAANDDQYPALNLEFKDQNWDISMEIRGTNRTQMIAIDDEIIRILDAKNKTPGGDYNWLELKGRKDLVQDINKPYFRMVRDVRVIRLSFVI